MSGGREKIEDKLFANAGVINKNEAAFRGIRRFALPRLVDEVAARVGGWVSG